MKSASLTEQLDVTAIPQTQKPGTGSQNRKWQPTAEMIRKEKIELEKAQRELIRKRKKRLDF
jgi:hypothetical protein